MLERKEEEFAITQYLDFSQKLHMRAKKKKGYINTRAIHLNSSISFLSLLHHFHRGKKGAIWRVVK